MCTIIIALKAHPFYPFVAVANRDEFYARPTLRPHFWQDPQGMFGGKDLTAGGSWLGFDLRGRFSALTNYRDPKNLRNDAPSRGDLVTAYFRQSQNGLAYMSQLSKSSGIYNGFNLLCGTFDELFYHSNYSEGVSKISDGIHGLSNSLLDVPWPKVKNGIAFMEDVLKKNTLAPEDFFPLISNPMLAPDDELPQTGLVYELEKSVSAMNIQTPKYGTCSSMVLLLDKNGLLSVHDRLYNRPDGEVSDERHLFKIK